MSGWSCQSRLVVSGYVIVMVALFDDMDAPSQSRPFSFSHRQPNCYGASALVDTYRRPNILLRHNPL